MRYADENVKSVHRTGGPAGRRGMLRLDLNENPEGLPEEFFERVKGKITPELVASYPDPTDFIAAYSKRTGIPKECVLPSNGSDSAIRHIMQVFAKKGSEVVGVTPSFEMYRVNCGILGLKFVGIPYDSDYTMDVSNILVAINDDTSIVVLLNPNNPIGNVYSEEEVASVIEKAEAHGATVIIDEAYHYFHSGTFVDFIEKHDNVIVLRTFSKLCSIAGCRVGVALSSPENIRLLRNSMPSFDVNSVGLLFATEIMEDPDLIGFLVEAEASGKEFLKDSLRKRGYQTLEGAGNYIFIKTKKSPEALAEMLKKRGILVKTYSYEELKGFIRVTTGGRRAMSSFVEAFLELDGE